jgi:hypothetical protein
MFSAHIWSRKTVVFPEGEVYFVALIHVKLLNEFLLLM